MENKPSKEQIARYEKIKEDLIKSPLFERIQQVAKEHQILMDKVVKDLKPTLDQIRKVQEQVKSFQKIETQIVINRPVEYYILDELRELNRKSLFQTQTIKSEDIVIIYNTEDNLLERNIDGKKFSYDLTENSKRKLLLDTLVRQKTYAKTEILKKLLSCPTTQAVAKVVQTFNDYAKVSLQLKKEKLIQGKKGSGYRINSKIIIQKE